MSKYAEYESEKKRIWCESKSMDEYDEKIRRLVVRLKI
jgi:hypothetical protein